MTNEPSRDELLGTLLHLAEGCPFEKGNPPFCPLHLARIQGLEETAKWLHSMEDSDLRLLARHHEICLQLLASGQFSG